MRLLLLLLTTFLFVIPLDSEATNLIDGAVPYEYERKSIDWLDNFGVQVWVDYPLSKEDKEYKDVTMRGNKNDEFFDNSIVIVTLKKETLEVATIRSVDLYNFSLTLNEGVCMIIYVALLKDLHGQKAGHYKLEF